MQTLAAERKRQIVAIVDRERVVRVDQLAELFQVTQETIRRDLERLADEGKVVRSHGGALSLAPSTEVSATQRDASMIAEKVAIAVEAAKRIKPDDTMILDASTTALYLARIMSDMPLTVLTNSIPVCVELSTRPRIRVVCTGGLLSSPSLSFVGPRAEQILRDYRVNRLFFSSTAIDGEHGLSDTNEMQAALRRAMMSVSDECCLMVDRSKFGLRALTRFASIGELTTVITDEAIPAEQAQAIAQAGVELVLARREGKR